jgi:hydroxyethylthiazole kinase-like uncharacterized protein yjeF
MHKNCAMGLFCGRDANAGGAKMTEVLTSAQMRAIERAAIDSGAVTGLELMERAGQGVVDAILAQWPELAAGNPRAVVLCGPGNNGGDGFVVARLLAGRGWVVKVYAWGDPERRPPDATAMSAALPSTVTLKRLGAAVVPRWYWDHSDPPDPALVVDALFGIGLSRYPVPVHRLLERYCPPRRRWKVVAVDIPSVLDPETGQVFDPGAGIRALQAFSADLTVTFHGPKPGHLADEGLRLCGKLVVADIGLGPWDQHRHDA